jgi:hypothetical protein
MHRDMQLLVGELNSSHSGVNGQAIGPRTNIDELLSYRIGKQTTLSLKGPGGPYEASVLPVNAATDKRLLYRGWVEDQRAYVSNDVRNNNGGFVNSYALDIFTRRGFMTMQSRDQPAAPARSLLGQRHGKQSSAGRRRSHSPCRSGLHRA